MMNNKGFTLVELIAVLVVIITILLITIPSISSSVERNKEKLNDKNEKIIYDAAEIYSELYLAQYYELDFSNGECGIQIEELIGKSLVDEKTTIIEKDNQVYELKELCVLKEDKDYIMDSCIKNDVDRRCGLE